MALTTESAPKLRGYTVRDDGSPDTDILDADGKLRITVYPDVDVETGSFVASSIPAAEALTIRIANLINASER